MDDEDHIEFAGIPGLHQRPDETRLASRRGRR